MPTFIPGLELNRRFYADVVQPLLAEAFPTIAYAAALLGPGSEILGFDTELSTDHDWGARLFLVLRREDRDQRQDIANLLSHRLPGAFAGFAIHFDRAADNLPTRIMTLPVTGPVHHRVIAITLHDLVRIQLGYDLDQPLSAADWLAIPSHSLGEMTAGAVYHDAVGELTALRHQLTWYPHDVWLYLLAASWQRIGEEEHLMPRAGSAGDELGSAIIGSRLVREVMRLCFLMERRYAPYPKWFGTAFNRLRAAAELRPLLWQAQQATTWVERETALARAYETLARMHNALGVGHRLPETVSRFYTRPFQVIHGEQFAQSLLDQIRDPDVQRIAANRLIGNIDQWSDNTAIEGIERSKIGHLYT